MHVKLSIMQGVGKKSTSPFLLLELPSSFLSLIGYDYQSPILCIIKMSKGRIFQSHIWHALD